MCGTKKINKSACPPDKSNVYLFQVNHTFGDQAFLPYSVGMLQAFAQADPTIAANYCFAAPRYAREPIDEALEKIIAPFIIGLSCYVWNWEYNTALARAVKERHPSAVVVLGGPHVPEDQTGFFRTYPYVDIVVHGEGEVTFREALLSLLEDAPDLRRVRGISFRVGTDSHESTPRRERVSELDMFPSPYLEGVFHDVMLSAPHLRWNASHETNRGCPYSCTFCDWGSSVFTKLRTFNMERLKAEINWFGENGIEVVYNCDSNYGIFERDVELAEILADVHRRFGYPKQFRPAFAKKSDARVGRIAEVLKGVEMQKGITLSIQSMDDGVLELIKRRNISVHDFATLVRGYRDRGVPTYTEIILGLPGETDGSFRHGIDRLFKAGQHEGCYIYPCQILPNAEMNVPAYRAMHGIETVRIPMPLYYVTPSDDGIVEYSEIVVSTATLSRPEWLNSMLFSWAVQCFHCMNLTQSIAIFLYAYSGLGYEEFYLDLLEYAQCHPSTAFGEEYRRARHIYERALSGYGMDTVIAMFGELTWSPEEASFLRLISRRQHLCAELTGLLEYIVHVRRLLLPDQLLCDLVTFQDHTIVDYSSPERSSVSFSFDLPTFVASARQCLSPDLRTRPTDVVFTAADIYPDPQTYAVHAIRFGRKSNRLRRAADHAEAVEAAPAPSAP